MQNNNPLTEAFLGAAAVLLILGAILLLYVSKIDGTFATLMFGAAAALFGGNLALKAPSPAQQQQLAAQHQDLQTLASQIVSVLPGLFQTQQQPVQAPQPVPPMPVQQPQPAPYASTPQVQQQPFPPSGTFPLPVVPK